MGAAVVFTTGAWAADAAAGKALYSTKCKTCHGATGTPSAAFVKMGIKPMNDPAIQGESDSALKDVILKGKGKMKAVAGVSDAQADDLVAAIRSMK